VAWDVGAHVLPRGEGGHVVVVFYHTYYNRKFRQKTGFWKSESKQIDSW
jgi:hypothetical protein